MRGRLVGDCAPTSDRLLICLRAVPRLLQTVLYWKWFYESSVVQGLAAKNGFASLPPAVATVVLDRLLADIRCNGTAAGGKSHSSEGCCWAAPSGAAEALLLGSLEKPCGAARLHSDGRRGRAACMTSHISVLQHIGTAVYKPPAPWQLALRGSAALSPVLALFAAAYKLVEPELTLPCPRW